MQVNVLEAKNRLSMLIKSAHAGEEVVIANRGRPVARLISSIPAAGKAADHSGVLDWLAAHPLPAHARRRQAEIAAGIKAERAAWG